jgi:predicted ABC-type exoprotein transport system permease subunit
MDRLLEILGLESREWDSPRIQRFFGTTKSLEIGSYEMKRKFGTLFPRDLLDNRSKYAWSTNIQIVSGLPITFCSYTINCMVIESIFSYSSSFFLDPYVSQPIQPIQPIQTIQPVISEEKMPDAKKTMAQPLKDKAKVSIYCSFFCLYSNLLI